jgi:hypothetical protein
MRKRDEYHSKVTVDTGMARARVPTPLLKVMGARVGNYLTFRLASSGEAIVRLSPSRVKPGARSTKKTSSGKRR